MFWFFNLVYALLLVAVSPVLLYRAIVLGKYRDGFAEKFLGRLPKRDSENHCVWFHAVSVGEVLQLQTVIGELAKQHPEWEIWITTTTHTGHKVAREKFSEHQISYFPLDFSWAVRRAIQQVRPSMIVLVELELWPNFIRAASEANVTLSLINGRISEKSFQGYRRVRFLMRSLLGRFDLLAVQSETYQERLKELGASPPEKIHVTGSIKFDGAIADRNNPRTDELRHALGISEGERVFIAGSTQDPEEGIALDAYESLKPMFPGLRLILVPRHQERFEEVGKLVNQRGFALIRRSDSKQSIPLSGGKPAANRSSKDQPVLLLDTLGELSACWGLAEIAFVGGSLTNRGGQNMIEPSAYGAAVFFGPNTRNFRDVVELLRSQDAAKIVPDADAFTARLRHWLSNKHEAARFGRRARTLVLSQQGATAKTIRLLEAVQHSELEQTWNRAA